MEKLEKEQARDLFLQTELSNQNIADLLNVDRKTVSRWIKEDQWREMKHAALQAPAAVLLELYDQLTALNRNISNREPYLRFPTKEEALIQRRLMTTIKTVERQHPGNYMQTYSELIEELEHADTDLATEVFKYADSIIRRKNQKDKRFNTLQHMFIEDELSEAVSRASASNSEEQVTSPVSDETRSLACPPLAGAGGGTDNKHISPPSGTSWDIEKNTITQQDQPSTQNISTPMPQKNVTKDGTLACPPLEGVKGEDVIKNVSNSPLPTTPPTPSYMPKLKPGIKYNGGWLDWLGNAMVRDYEENNVRKITTDEWNAFLATGYKLSELDNYNFKSDTAYDEERKKLLEQRHKAYTEQRERIERFKLSMKNEYHRNNNRRINRY